MDCKLVVWRKSLSSGIEKPVNILPMWLLRLYDYLDSKRAGGFCFGKSRRFKAVCLYSFLLDTRCPSVFRTTLSYA